MKKLVLTLTILAAFAWPVKGFSDHRGHNLDSLEHVVAGWTTERLATASEAESSDLVYAFTELARGYLPYNNERSMLFSRKCYELALRWNWLSRMSDSMDRIGVLYYGKEQYDSALVCFDRALAITDRMAAGETSFTSDKRYEEGTVDDHYSSLYGALGNTYNMMGDVPKAMEYYRKAGEIFTKHGWNESNSILWYNMGETWYEEGNMAEAGKSYDTALQFGKAAGDSLMMANALKGLGQVYLAKGRTGKALKCLLKAEEYYASHKGEELGMQVENLDFMRRTLTVQKKNMTLLAVVSAALVVLLLALLLILRHMRRLSKEKEGADVAIDEALRDIAKPQDEDLTEREEQILRLIADGLTSPQIAQKIYLSLATIKWYRGRLLMKFDAANTAELISKAKEKGLV